MAHADIHVGDTTTFRGTFKDEDGTVINISAFTTLEFKFRKPDGSTMVKTGTMVGDGSTGEMTYDPTVNDLDQVGNWEVQGFLVIPAGSYHSQVRQFRVRANVA